MTRDRRTKSIGRPEESESEREEDEEVEEERVDANAGSRKEAAVKAEDESGDEEDSSEKTNSQVRGLDYGSDGDSGKTFPSPSASAFVVKQKSKPETKFKKRSAESEPAKDMSEVKKAKKVKKGNGDANVSAEGKGRRSAGGQRIWGPEDELMILTGMLEYKEKTGVDYNSNFDAFHKYIKGSLNAIVDKTQLIGKIKKLREKYRLNAQKEANGEALLFLKDHDKNAYEHSKKLWGGKVVGRGSQGAKSKPISKNEVNGISKAPILEMDNVLALPVPEIEASKKVVVGGSTKAASRVRKVVKKMDSGEADIQMKDNTIPMPPMADNLMAEEESELVEKSKVDTLNEKPNSKKEVKVISNAPILEMDNVLAFPLPEIEASKKGVDGGSTKAASQVRNVVKKMDSGEADIQMKDYTIPMPAMADNLMAEKGLELVEKSKVDALNEKWTKYQMDAAQLYLRRLDLVMEHTKIILDALKSNP